MPFVNLSFEVSKQFSEVAEIKKERTMKKKDRQKERKKDRKKDNKKVRNAIYQTPKTKR